MDGLKPEQKEPSWEMFMDIQIFPSKLAVPYCIGLGTPCREVKTWSKYAKYADPSEGWHILARMQSEYV